MNAKEMIQYFEKVGYKVQRIDGGWQVTLVACKEERCVFRNQKDVWNWWRLKVETMYRGQCCWNHIAYAYSLSSGLESARIYEAVHRLMSGYGANGLMRSLSKMAGKAADQKSLPYRWRLWAFNHVNRSRNFNPIQHLHEIKSACLKIKLQEAFRGSCSANHIRRI